MVTAEFIQCVVRIRCDDWVGTGFITNRATTTLLVTARHILADVDASIENRPVEVYRGERFEQLQYTVAFDNIENDIAVLSVDARLAPPLSIELRSKGVALGQDMFCMSFPYGEMLNESFRYLNRDLPIALVKRLTLGALRVPQWIVTGDITRGDSGAPIAFYPPQSSTMCIAGVITGIDRYYEPVYLPSKTGEYEATNLRFAERGGYGFVVPIELVFTRAISNTRAGP